MFDETFSFALVRIGEMLRFTMLNPKMYALIVSIRFFTTSSRSSVIIFFVLISNIWSRYAA